MPDNLNPGMGTLSPRLNQIQPPLSKYSVFRPAPGPSWTSAEASDQHYVSHSSSGGFVQGLGTALDPRSRPSPAASRPAPSRPKPKLQSSQGWDDQVVPSSPSLADQFTESYALTHGVGTNASNPTWDNVPFNTRAVDLAWAHDQDDHYLQRSMSRQSHSALTKSRVLQQSQTQGRHHPSPSITSVYSSKPASSRVSATTIDVPLFLQPFAYDPATAPPLPSRPENASGDEQHGFLAASPVSRRGPQPPYSKIPHGNDIGEKTLLNGFERSQSQHHDTRDKSSIESKAFDSSSRVSQRLNPGDSPNTSSSRLLDLPSISQAQEIAPETPKALPEYTTPETTRAADSAYSDLHSSSAILLPRDESQHGASKGSQHERVLPARTAMSEQDDLSHNKTMPTVDASFPRADPSTGEALVSSQQEGDDEVQFDVHKPSSGQINDSFYWHSGRSSSDVGEEQDRFDVKTATQVSFNVGQETSEPGLQIGNGGGTQNLPMRSTSLSPLPNVTSYGASVLGFGGPSDWEYFGDYEAEEVDDEELYTRPRPPAELPAETASLNIDGASKQPSRHGGHNPDHSPILKPGKNMYHTDKQAHERTHVHGEARSSTIESEYHNISGTSRLNNSWNEDSRPLSNYDQRPDLDEVIRAWSQAPYVGVESNERLSLPTVNDSDKLADASLASTPQEQFLGIDVILKDAPEIPKLPESVEQHSPRYNVEGFDQQITSICSSIAHIPETLPTEALYPSTNVQSNVLDPLGSKYISTEERLMQAPASNNSQDRQSDAESRSSYVHKVDLNPKPTPDRMHKDQSRTSSLLVGEEAEQQLDDLCGEHASTSADELQTPQVLRRGSLVSSESLLDDQMKESASNELCVFPSIALQNAPGVQIAQILAIQSQQDLTAEANTDLPSRASDSSQMDVPGSTSCPPEESSQLPDGAIAKQKFPTRDAAAINDAGEATTAPSAEDNALRSEMKEDSAPSITDNTRSQRMKDTRVPTSTACPSVHFAEVPPELPVDDISHQRKPEHAEGLDGPSGLVSSEASPAHDPYSDLDIWCKASLNRYAAMLREEARAGSHNDKMNIFNVFANREARLRVVLYGAEDELILPRKTGLLSNGDIEPSEWSKTPLSETVPPAVKGAAMDRRLEEQAKQGSHSGADMKCVSGGFVRQVVARANTIGLQQSLKALPALPQNRESIAGLPHLKVSTICEDDHLRGSEQPPTSSAAAVATSSFDTSRHIVQQKYQFESSSQHAGGKPSPIVTNRDPPNAAKTAGEQASGPEASEDPVTALKVPMLASLDQSEVNRYITNRRSVFRPFASRTLETMESGSHFDRDRGEVCDNDSTSALQETGPKARLSTTQQQGYPFRVSTKDLPPMISQGSSCENLDLRRFADADFDPLIMNLPRTPAIIADCALLQDLREVMEAIPEDFSFIHASVVSWEMKTRKQREENDRQRHERQGDSEKRIDALFNDHEIGYGDISDLEAEFKRGEASRRADEDRAEYQAFVSEVFDLVWTRLHYELDQLLPHYEKCSINMDSALAGKEMFEEDNTGTTLARTMTEFLALHQKMEIRYQKAFEAVLERDRRLKKTEISPWYTLNNIAKVKQLEKQFEDAEKRAIIEYCEQRDDRANRLMDVLDQNTLRGVGANQDYMEAIMKAVRRIASGRAFASLPDADTVGLQEVQKARKVTALLATSSEEIVRTFHLADMLLNSADYEVHVAKAKVARADAATLSKLKEERAKEDMRLMRELEHRLALVREDSRKTNDEIIKLLLFLGVQNGRAVGMAPKALGMHMRGGSLEASDEQLEKAFAGSHGA